MQAGHMHGKKEKDMSPFNYCKARDGNSECTGVVNVIKVWRQKDIFMGKSQKDMCPFSYWSVVNVIKVRRQKNICMGNAKRTCVLLAIGEQEREIQNAQVNFIKVRRQKKMYQMFVCLLYNVNGDKGGCLLKIDVCTSVTLLLLTVTQSVQSVPIQVIPYGYPKSQKI